MKELGIKTPILEKHRESSDPGMLILQSISSTEQNGKPLPDFWNCATVLDILEIDAT